MYIAGLHRKLIANSRGSGVIEMLVTLGVTSIVLSIYVANLTSLRDPLQDGASSLVGFFKLARARAISTTSAVLIEPGAAGRITASTATNCNAATFDPIPNLFLDMPPGITTPDTTWSVCFSPRGLADDSPMVYLSDGEGRYKQLEVFLGGAVRLQ
ncbi:MAG: hypothetical protein IT291_06795 [Deltaproteobacteria bacterium]|nr:hypothetical protein [Deltaproteobacteria bacterium]